MTMDWYTKNALWIYYKRGDDEEMLTDDELSNLEEKNEENEIAGIFRIETDLFQFDTPLCKAFKDFNYLLQIDVDVLIGDLPGFKTYEYYKNTWLYEWNRTINDDTIQANQELFDEREPKGDNEDDIKDLDDYLVRDDAPFIVNKEEEGKKVSIQRVKHALEAMNELFSDYDCEICYHPRKENVVADGLSRKERVKLRRIRAMCMTIQSGVKDKILVAQMEATKLENAPAKILRGLDQLMEVKEDGGLYFMDQIWVPLVGSVRTLIMDKAHATSGHDTIWVIMDRLTKSAYFLAIREDYSMERLARIYINEVLSRHGVPVSIISDRDGRFTSRFWQTLEKALGARAYVIDFGGSWDTYLPLAMFSYNNCYHLSIRYAPFEALYGRNPEKFSGDHLRPPPNCCHLRSSSPANIPATTTPPPPKNFSNGVFRPTPKGLLSTGSTRSPWSLALTRIFPSPSSPAAVPPQPTPPPTSPPQPPLEGACGGYS
ncbi:putative reverse transcriptase domain-containing protein [Tanacetum coccineum]